LIIVITIITWIIVPATTVPLVPSVVPLPILRIVGGITPVIAAFTVEPPMGLTMIALRIGILLVFRAGVVEFIIAVFMTTLILRRTTPVVIVVS
jgi:hypothetical protein